MDFIDKLNTYSHQHLSNYYWFCLILTTTHGDDFEEARSLASQMITTKFGGRILDYALFDRSESEIRFLKKKGLIKEKKFGPIYFKNKKIGYYYPMPPLLLEKFI